jgi:RND family efflux transporter MFP subunit
MKRNVLIVLSAAALLAGCGKEEAPTAQAAAVPPAPTFSVVPLGEAVFHPERSAPATVVGRNEARLSAEVAAVIQTLPADVGQTVARGAIVARLDPRDAQLALERAEAVLAQAAARHAQAQAQHERARTLREKNFYSAEALTLRETELKATAADLRAATAQRDTARRALDKHVLRAPFDGVVRARNGQVGELAAPGALLLTLVETRDPELSAQVQPQDAASLAAAQTPQFESGGATHALKLLRISPAHLRESRSVTARLIFKAMPPPLGAEGRLVWRDAQAHLPADLLVRRDGRYGVFVAEGDKARFHLLPEAQEGRPAAIDLPPDTRIVTQGRHALQDGMALK